MRVGLLTQWYDPEPGPAALPGVLARGLVARGHEVTVLTGFPNYPSGQLADGYEISRRQDEILDGVRVRRVALYPSHDASAVRRLANYASFGASALLSGTDALRDVDVLWVNYSPITVAPAMWWVRHRHGVPTVVHVLDLWPDTVMAGGFGEGALSRRALGSTVNAWVNRMYASAARVVVNSPGVRDVLTGRGVDPATIEYVPLWADESVFRPTGDGWRSRLGLGDDDVVLLYAGTLGEAQGLDTLLEACARVDDPRFVCLVAGSGVAEESLRARAVSLGLTNVRFVGRFPQDEMTELMGAADASFVSLRDHPLSRITMPSKFQAALASGRCLVVSADGDLAEAARTSGAGFVAAGGDADDLAEALRSLCATGRPGLQRLGLAAREAYERGYSVQVGVDRMERVLAEASGALHPSAVDGGELVVRRLASGDVAEAARLHRVAFPDFFLSALGDRFLREFYRGFVDDPTAVTAVVRTAGGRLAGVAVGTTRPDGFFKRLLRRQFRGFVVASVLATLRRPTAAVRLLRGLVYRGEPSGTGALLSSICVSPAVRGRGVGARTLAEWTDEARRLGAPTAHLSTDADGNEAVNRFYAAHGWRLAHGYTTREGRRMHLYERDVGESGHGRSVV